MKKPIGRPKLPKDQAKEVFTLRLSPAEKALVMATAITVAQKPGEWARNVLLTACSGNPEPVHVKNFTK
jgi:hypothetical protein